MESLFLTKQRAFLKLYLVQLIKQGKGYGLQLQGEVEKNFKAYGFIPTKTEIYRSLHDLLEEGIVSRRKLKKEGAKRAEIAVYSILDVEKANTYMRSVRSDMDRSVKLLQHALKDTEKK